MSARADGRGHWPAGKRRKEPTGLPVGELLAASIARRGLRGTGRALGVDTRTVGRWRRGERHPDAEEAARIIALGDDG